MGGLKGFYIQGLDSRQVLMRCPATHTYKLAIHDAQGDSHTAVRGGRVEHDLHSARPPFADPVELRADRAVEIHAGLVGQQREVARRVRKLIGEPRAQLIVAFRIPADAIARPLEFFS